jgi:hypothetical protein
MLTSKGEEDFNFYTVLFSFAISKKNLFLKNMC